MERHVLRPQPGHNVPIIVLSGLGTVGGIALAAGLLAAKDSGGAAFVAIAGLIVGSSCVAYFRNARIWFDDEEVGKVSLLNVETKCRRDHLRDVEMRLSPQPTLNFVRKDGSTAFRINARLWTDSQITMVRDGIRS